MSLGVEVTVNERQLARFLEELSVRELPFAMSLAMNRAAKDTVAHVRQEVPQRFTIRSRGVLRGFGFSPTHKREWPDLRLDIGTRDEFWVLQQTGGTKKPRRGKNLAIPTRLVRRTKTGRISASRRPRAIIGAGKARVAEGAIRAVRKRARGPEILYLLRGSARIEPRLQLDRMVRTSFGRLFPRNFGRAFAYAKRTSRDRAAKVKG